MYEDDWPPSNWASAFVSFCFGSGVVGLVRFGVGRSVRLVVHNSLVLRGTATLVLELLFVMPPALLFRRRAESVPACVTPRLSPMLLELALTGVFPLELSRPAFCRELCTVFNGNLLTCTRALSREMSRHILWLLVCAAIARISSVLWSNSVGPKCRILSSAGPLKSTLGGV